MPQEPIEVAFARLDERFQGFEKAFGKMSDDMSSLVESYQKLVESNQRIALLDNDIITLKQSINTLWTKFDTHVSAHNKASNSILFEIGKMVLVLVAGLIAGHFGFH